MTAMILLVAFGFVVLLLIGLAGAVVLISKNQAAPSQAAPSQSEVFPFRKKQYLLSKGERAFFDVLSVAVGDEMFIFCKVRLEDLLYLPKGTPGRQGWSNKVRQKHVDFVLCDHQSISPLLVIELDDASHQREAQRKRDADKDKALQAAGLPIRRVPARSSYDPRQLANLIQKALQS